MPRNVSSFLLYTVVYTEKNHVLWIYQYSCLVITVTNENWAISQDMSQAFLIAKLINHSIWAEFFSQKCYTENCKFKLMKK